MLANVFQRSNREASRRVCAPLCRRNLFKYHKKNVFWLQIPFLWLLFSPPGGDGGGVKWSSDIDAPVKTIVPPFPKTGNRARFTYLCENTIFFLPHPREKTLPETVFKFLSYLFLRRFVVVGWVNPYSMCVDLELEQLRQLSGKL